jgi:hypothetical protein
VVRGCGRSLAEDEREPIESGETLEGYQCWIVGLCIQMAFARTQVPHAVVEAVKGLAERYGVEAGIEAAYAVLCAFEAGRRGK